MCRLQRNGQLYWTRSLLSISFSKCWSRIRNGPLLKFFQWSYLCADGKTVKNSISIQMLGVLFGSIVFGQLSDSFGRKNVKLHHCSNSQASGNASVYIWNVERLAYGCLFKKSHTFHSYPYHNRFFHWRKHMVIYQLLQSFVLSVVNIFILENVPKHLRMWISMAITWSPNMPIMALIAWLFPSWDQYAITNAFLCVPPILFCGWSKSVHVASSLVQTFDSWVAEMVSFSWKSAWS